MREAQTSKVPITLIIGDKEKEAKNISYRLFGTSETTTLSQDEFVDYVLNQIKAYK